MIFKDGFNKLIVPQAMPVGFVPECHIVDSRSGFNKMANDMGLTQLQYDSAKPDADHVGVHFIALGDYERFGWNRNGDSFPKLACANYHDTFVKFGNVFEHHNNKDPEKRIGNIKLSCYNEPMGRVELYVHLHRVKAAEHIERLSREGELPGSMACNVLSDRCNRCQHIRKAAADPDTCDHVKYSLGKMAEDGTITGTYNDAPRFFDYSCVRRPADRIAWSLKVAGAELELDSSIKLAEMAGLWLPESVIAAANAGSIKLQLLRKLAGYEREIIRVIAEPRFREPSHDLLVRSFCKAAASEDDGAAIINQLRDYDMGEVFVKLAELNVVLSPRQFFDYALGKTAAAENAVVVDAAIKYIGYGIFSMLEKNAEAVIADNGFDTIYGNGSDLVESRCARTVQHLAYNLSQGQAVTMKTAGDRARSAALTGVDAVLIADKPSIRVSTSAVTLAEKYASYKLSTLAAINSRAISNPNDVELPSLATVTAQHMVTRRT